ncbi:UDP-glucose 4-epimerase GalE [Actinocorallia sp. A-T 12471]|uniref:UDP-glucose 4-epimerase GalE n=1 Tax=Actinocorallia sp. A-T 12471 TaxID=3089813 RepID=UPI0029D27950|nr:UDP-glucose 4-epimerase GalE [Actinocorallia sp. A-T 12471]MDX6741838.1 UDP-glucose 4-epimerase GalE [Actinocorallia sp. A-T 12471]
MKILVTGGAGYIGSVVAAQLIESGHTVVVLDNLTTGSSVGVPPGVEFVQGDVKQAGDVLGRGGFDAVMHFAARSQVGESVRKPEMYWDNNVGGTLALLEAMRGHGVRRIVFSSTAATYGVVGDKPITEDAPVAPINPYGQSKIAVDFALQGEATAHGLAATSLRYFNVGGAYAGLGERHDPETHLIPNVLRAAAGLIPAVELYGTDYPTPDGTAIRDYLHVADLAEAHLLALDAVEPGIHTIYNLGSGTGTSVREIIDTAGEVTGLPIPVNVHPRRPGDPPYLVASATRIAHDLGWKAHRPLPQIIADAWTFLNSTL